MRVVDQVSICVDRIDKRMPSLMVSSVLRDFTTRPTSSLKDTGPYLKKYVFSLAGLLGDGGH